MPAIELEGVELDRHLAANDLSAYARLILDILEGQWPLMNSDIVKPMPVSQATP